MEFTTHDAVKLDKNGNIDTKVLEKELVESLKFDITYKQQDNMKKRAVKQAPSYDDFKNMVACAHLKKVTKQDIEELGKSKKCVVRAKPNEMNLKFNCPMNHLSDKTTEDCNNMRYDLLF